jgi:hypothetical protein
MNDAIINKNGIRIGCVMKRGGKCMNWIHLKCFRVPSIVWNNLSDPHDYELSSAELRSMNGLFQGLDGLNGRQTILVVNHLTNKNYWETKQGPKDHPVQVNNGNIDNKENNLNTGNVKVSLSPEFRFKERYRFSIPRAKRRKFNCLRGKTFVLNGVFPEVGGGTRSLLGKEKLKCILESFGGAVSSTLTSLTSYLVTGQERKCASLDFPLDVMIDSLILRTLMIFLLANQSQCYAAKQKNILIIDLPYLEQLISGKLDCGQTFNH